MRFASFKAAILIVVAIYAGLVGYISWCSSPVMQEPAQLVAGVNGWQSGRFEIFHVNPPLVRSVATLPVLLQSPIYDAKKFDRPPIGREEHAMASDFLADNCAHAQMLFVVARWACIFFGFVGAYACWRWASSLYGMCAGLTTVGLWCFSPYVLGHGATIMADVPAAAMGVATAYCFWHWLKWSRWQEALVVGFMLGLAELCKFTLLIFYPLFLVLWIAYRLSECKTMVWRDWLRQGGMLAVVLLVSVYIINLGYFFEGTFTPLEKFRFQTTMFTGYDAPKNIPPGGANRFGDTWIGKLPVPFPANFVQGIDTQRLDFERGLPSYLRGEWADHGWWYYYLYALAIKEPLGTWCLVTLAIGATIFGRGYSASWRDEMVVFMPFVAILVFISSQTGFSVHSRYVIPALPFLFVWTSKAAQVFAMRPFTRRRLVTVAMIVMSLIWSVGSSLAVYPHSLSYFNELAAVLPTPADASYPNSVAGSDDNRSIFSTIKWAINAGPLNGPHHLIDSNIDWGQDLLYLKDWLDRHPDVKLDGLAYWGSYPTTLTGIPDTPDPPIGKKRDPYHSNSTDDQIGPGPGWYAVSVNKIYGRSQQHRYFLSFKPVATAGYSIYIYHITLDDANRVRKKLGLPALSEKGVAKEDAEGGGHG